MFTRRLQGAEIKLVPCSDSHRQSFGDLAGLDRPAGLPPLRVDSGKRLAFSNPQPTAFPSHGLNVSALTCCAVLVPHCIPERCFSGCTQRVCLSNDKSTIVMWDLSVVMAQF